MRCWATALLHSDSALCTNFHLPFQFHLIENEKKRHFALKRKFSWHLLRAQLPQRRAKKYETKINYSWNDFGATQIGWNGSSNADLKRISASSFTATNRKMVILNFQLIDFFLLFSSGKTSGNFLWRFWEFTMKNFGAHSCCPTFSANRSVRLSNWELSANWKQT